MQGTSAASLPLCGARCGPSPLAYRRTPGHGRGRWVWLLPLLPGGGPL